MKNTAVALGAVLLLAMATSSARAECTGPDICWYGGGSSTGLKVALGAYAGVTLGMGIKDLATADHSVAYGYAETIIHAPLALAWGSVAVAELTSSSGDHSDAPWLLGFTAVHAALAAHGVYTIGKDRSDKEATPAAGLQVGRVRAALAPTPVKGGAGLGIGGTF